MVGEILEVEWTGQQLTFASKVAVIPLAATSLTEFIGPNGVELKFVIGKEGKATHILFTAVGLSDTRATRVDRPADAPDRLWCPLWYSKGRFDDTAEETPPFSLR